MAPQAAGLLTLPLSTIVSETLLAVFIVFCRIGGCLMIVPGYGSTRVPMQIRLMIAISVSLALAPGLVDAILVVIRQRDDAIPVALIGSELLVGMTIGLMCRVFFLALDTMLSLMSNLIGYSSAMGVSLEDNETEASLGAFIGLAAVTVLFLTGQQWELLRGLLLSYKSWPVTGSLSPQYLLFKVTDVLAMAFYVCLRLASPFVVFGLISNFAMGLINKFTPQIPVFFIATPFILAAGLLLLFFVTPEFLHLFITAYANWLRSP
jgi:flagellar biosynthetic protein FliR